MNARQALIALAAGLLFGFGLLLSGMADPARVRAFLDFGSGHWDYRLMLVMAGAIAVALPAFAWVRRRGRTPGGIAVTLPDRQRIDRRLIGGAALFGLGWGLSGLCPGPALLVAFGGLSTPALVFVAALALGHRGSAWLLARR